MAKNISRKNNRDSSKGFGKDQPMMPVGVILSENANWETYYKSLNLIPESEWDDFKSLSNKFTNDL